MPEAGKASLKREVAAEAPHWVELHPNLEVVCIADGAPDNWAYFSAAFPGATQVYDFWHAAQHLQEALNSAYGEGSTEAQHRFQTLRRVLKEEEDGIERVIRSLRYLARKHPDRKAISRVLAFFRKQRHRMRYAEMKERGRPIGSGVVEAANKVLIQQRLKCSGMRWSEHGTGQHILSIRALCKSSRFRAAWRQITRALEAPHFEFRDRKTHNILQMAT